MPSGHKYPSVLMTCLVLVPSGYKTKCQSAAYAAYNRSKIKQCCIVASGHERCHLQIVTREVQSQPESQYFFRITWLWMFTMYTATNEQRMREKWRSMKGLIYFILSLQDLSTSKIQYVTVSHTAVFLCLQSYGERKVNKECSRMQTPDQEHFLTFLPFPTVTLLVALKIICKIGIHVTELYKTFI